MRMIVEKAAIAIIPLLLTGAAPLAANMTQPGPIPVASSSAGGQAEFASGQQVRAQIAAMLAEMTSGQGFLWRPLVRDGSRVAAIEIWKKAGRPAVHPTEIEYAVVLEGAGTRVSGGTLIAPVTRREGLIEGTRIEGGSTRTLSPGDVLLVSAAVPHWFGVTGEHLVLLGTNCLRTNNGKSKSSTVRSAFRAVEHGCQAE